MKKIITFLLIIAMSITITDAQIKGGAAFFKTGYLYAPRSSNIFKKIALGGTPHFNNNYLIMGVEAYYRTGNLILGWDGYSGEQPDYSFATNSYAEPFIGSTHIRLGRIVKENKQYWVYPSIGMGATGIVLATYNKVNGKSLNTINQILLSPTLDIGINEDIIVTKVNPNEKRYGGLILGIRAGYRTSYSSNNWRNDDWVRLYNKPFYSNNCFYLSVSIGAGGFVSK
ncbi:hypothetical protein [Segetibacter koreensis]|uniref:hypothetical protein n=1 Tax=Segetibacter koreensis TaxID=398037 RepID=UPI00036E14C0|nr:hypothetical protein [Segetibacter koreensis]